MKKDIETEKAPQAIGPYSQAVRRGNLIFCSGQIPLSPEGNLVEGDIQEQTKQILENIGAILEAGGLKMDSIVKTTIYLTDLEDFAVVNEVYARFFSKPFPARATVGVASLPKGAKVEIEAIAFAE